VEAKRCSSFSVNVIACATVVEYERAHHRPSSTSRCSLGEAGLDCAIDCRTEAGLQGDNIPQHQTVQELTQAIAEAVEEI